MEGPGAMRNPYLTKLSKIEFVVTNACTGRCKHCSEGEHPSCGERIDRQLAADAVRKIAAEYDIKTVMAFGGEPLLCADAVFAIMNAACEMKVLHRQVITNGYFSRDAVHVRAVAEGLAACGVNDLCISVDAFHQETIPLETVKRFAMAVRANGVSLRLQPAWLVSRTDENPYNRRTREILESVGGGEIPVGEGNVVFFEGNARRYLAAYFADTTSENPYAEDPRDLRCISFCANGDVLGGNVYERDIIVLIKNYAP